MARIGGSYNTTGHLRVRHQCGALSNAVQSIEILADAIRFDFPDEVPHGRLRRHNVRLIAAIDDDVVRTL